MNFHVPGTLEAALGILAQEPEARCLAGGQTLVAMMNADLVRPSAIVSLRGIGTLRGISRSPDGAVMIGATTTHASLSASDRFAGAQAVIPLAAGRIAHAPIRNAGTIGGSIAHADPAADLPTAITAADAEIEIAALGKPRRRVTAGEFFRDYLTTCLEPGEMVTAVHCPASPPGAVAHYEKLVRVDGDFAIVSVAVVLALAEGKCVHARLVAGACGATPIRSEAAEAILLGSGLGASEIAAAAAALVQACSPLDDFRGSAAYRLKVMPRLLQRAVPIALAKRQ